MGRLMASIGVIALLAACGGDDLASPTGNPDFTFSSSVSAAIIPKGSSATATLTILRKDGYASPVELSASGVPAGVTVQFAPQSVAQTTSGSTALITVSSAATSGNPILTFRAVGAGVTEKTAVYSLVIP
jgi:hypothetical protein